MRPTLSSAPFLARFAARPSTWLVAITSTVLTAAIGMGGPGVVSVARAEGSAAAKPSVVPGAPVAPAAPIAATKFSIAMTLIERSGATLATRNVDVTLGVVATTTVQRKERTVTIDTTVTAGTKPGCYKIDLVVRDRNIDATGRFNKTVWQSATEPCDPQPITLGPKTELRVSVSVNPVR